MLSAISSAPLPRHNNVSNISAKDKEQTEKEFDMKKMFAKKSKKKHIMKAIGNARLRKISDK